jgi:hypothetical protein
MSFFECPVDFTGIPVAQTQNSVDPDNVDTSNDEGVRQDSIGGAFSAK